MLDKWINLQHIKNNANLRKQFLENKPFSHLVLGNFFNEKRINKVLAALKQESFAEKNSDLFQFKQTADIKHSRNKVLQEFHKFFSSKEFLSFISELTGIRVSSIDMSGFIYGDTDHLLPHDDRLEGRKIAYILNLTKNFNKEDGGSLDLFGFRNNKPTNVLKSIPPTFNTLTIFKVQKNSFHQVSEVLSKKKRFSFGGWFHG